MTIAWLKDMFTSKRDERTEAMNALQRQRQAARRSLENSRENAQSAAEVLDGIMTQKRQTQSG